VPNTLDDLQAKYETSWQSGYRYFPAVLEARGLKIGVEVGVAFGGHSEALLARTRISKLYGVDSYRYRPDYHDPMNLPQAEFDRLYERMVRRLSGFGDRFTPIRKDSEQAVADVSGPIDFVYIDADHSYLGVFNDLCRWTPKVRPGGIIGGHDYDHVDFPGVKQAVDEFFRRFGWKVHPEGDGVWWVQMQSLNVSYIMPAYNCERTVAESVESIVAGNWEDNDELVIVDDGSTDRTPSVLQEVAARSPRITVLTHTRNKGGGAARNTAVEHAKHPLILCLDSDNLLAPGSTAPLCDFLVGSGADVAAFEEIRYFKHSPREITHKWVLTAGRVGLADYLGDYKVPGSSGNYLFTKESWARAGGYPEFAGALDTWGFGLRQVATGSKMMVQSGSFYLHCTGGEGYWLRQERQGNTNLLALQVMIPFLHLIEDRDVDYVMSRAGRQSWLNNLKRRPLHVKRTRPAGAIDPGFAAVLRPRRALGWVKHAGRRVAQRLGLGSATGPGPMSWMKRLRARRAAARWTDDDARRLAFYSQFISRGDIVFDVGANVGNRTKIFRKLAKTVVAIEPQEQCIAILRQQFGGDRRVKLVSKALGARQGVAEMLVSSANAISSLSREWIEAVQRSGRFSDYKWEQQQKVELTTLDQLIAEYGTPGFIKIDVEGYEHEVLLGLSRAVRALSFEFVPEYLAFAYKCVEHLSLLGCVQFNYSLGESMELALPGWVPSWDIKRELSKYADNPSLFGDVYARCENRTP